VEVENHWHIKTIGRSCNKQEAQLSQRDRTTFCVTEYFAMSLKVIRHDTVE